MMYLQVVGGNKKAANPALVVPCFQLTNADKEGFMNKLGGSGLTPKNWRRRWFVLKDKKLYYYKTAFVSPLHVVQAPPLVLVGSCQSAGLPPTLGLLSLF